MEPVAKGRTPMKAALQMAHRLAAAWCRKHPSSFPPIVINITDGEATDATAEELLCVADRLKSLGTDDGSLLLFNIHVNAKPSQEEAVVKWPADVSTLPDSRNAQLSTQWRALCHRSTIHTSHKSRARSLRRSIVPCATTPRAMTSWGQCS